MKVSLICTLKNEESSIKEFLDSLLSQSRPPDEIIIVDGGSTDKTVEIIKSYIGGGAPIKLLIEKGINIAQGRNIAIRNSKYDIIASTDAGCRIDKHWLENIIKPFKDNPDTEVVSGWYEADTESVFERCVAELTYPKLRRVLSNPDGFLPSSRSIAYKKEAWQKVGGYPEWLYTAEDTLFDLSLKKAGFKFTFSPNAIVYWKPRPNLYQIFKQTFLYRRGDGHAKLPFYRNYWRKYVIYGIGISLLAIGFYYYLVWIFLFIGLFIYLLKPSILIQRRIKAIKSALITPLIILAIDLGVLIGYPIGFLENIFRFRVGSKWKRNKT